MLINHNIRKNSSNEAHKVKTLLKKYKINLKVISNKRKIERNIRVKEKNKVRLFKEILFREENSNSVDSPQFRGSS